MRSAELQKCGETALQRRLRHRSVICHMIADLIDQCGEDGEAARAIGPRVINGLRWIYTGCHSECPSEELVAVRQRLLTNQLVGYLVLNAGGLDDALAIGRLFLRGIEWAWGPDQRDLRLVC